ncbi:MAG: VWA domain-containing protein [Acidobacteria bacterium]|nr:VWA domain-containing protein [Acidobacteriota bacterium]
MILSTLLLSLWAAASSQDAVFRASVALVRADAQVIESGNIVRNLTKEDFILRDNGEPREILYFGQEDEPLDVIVVLDTSGSMDKAIQQVRDAAREALRALRPTDRVAVTRFTRHPSTAIPFTEDRARVEQAIAEICSRPFGGGTDILGALQHASDQFLGLARTRRRRAILIITDGQSQSYSPQQAALRKLWEADAVLNALQVKGPRFLNGGMNLRMRLMGVDLKELAAETGGEVVKATRIGDDFQRTLERMRLRYSIHFAPKEGTSGQQRAVSIELSEAARRRHPSARVHARKAYVCP